jgi:hypothetical protein
MATVAHWIGYRGRPVEPTDNGRVHILDGHAERAGRLTDIGNARAFSSLVLRDRRVRRAELLYGTAAGRFRIMVVVINRPAIVGWVGEGWTACLTARTQEGVQL